MNQTISDNSKQLKQLFEKISMKYSRSIAFFDMVTMFAIALSNRVDLAQYEQREAEYLKLVKKYDKPTIEIFTNILARLTLALAEEPSDYLGYLYMEFGFNNGSLGQHFTPHHVAELMARLTMGTKQSIEAQKNERGRISVMDNCCGGGQLLIGYYNALFAAGCNPINEMEVYAKDIGNLPAKMCYVQLFLLGVPGVVIQGNGLAPNDIIQEWFLPYHNSSQITVIPKEELRATPQYEQLVLF